ncbi:MAG: DUF362 domain-containing protein [Promethearchaeota archaeon]
MTANKIAIIKIKQDNVKDAVFNALELINAKELMIKTGMKILLKPNILLSKEPERGATTHPEILKSVIQWLKQFNPEKIIVAESSGTFKRGATEKAFKGSGLQSVCEDEGVEWTSFAKTQRKTYKIKNPLVLEEITASTLLDEVDLIVNLPKIKTHGQCILTCCIKNMFGILILGNKARTHAQFPTREKFNAALTDIYSVSNPQLTIIDGYYTMEGNGPSAGDVVKLDLILAGYDPVALDTAVCKIVGFDPNEIYYISQLEQKGFGNSEFDVLGEAINSVKRKFKKPKGAPVSLPLPEKIAKYVGRVVFRSSIKFDKSKCKLCSTCWNNCPTGAITPPKDLEKGKNIPKWDKKKCITCYCCAELCPYEAVDFKINFIKNVVTSWLIIPLLTFLLVLLGIIFLVISLFS